MAEKYTTYATFETESREQFQCTCPTCKNTIYLDPGKYRATIRRENDGSITHTYQVTCENCRSKWDEEHYYNGMHGIGQRNVSNPHTYDHKDLQVSNSTNGVSQAVDLINQLNTVINDNGLNLVFNSNTHEMLIVNKNTFISINSCFDKFDEQYLGPQRKYIYRTPMKIHNVMTNFEKLCAMPAKELGK